MRPDDPEPQIAATALLGLWPVQLHAAVSADVRRPARLLTGGLATVT